MGPKRFSFFALWAAAVKTVRNLTFIVSASLLAAPLAYAAPCGPELHPKQVVDTMIAQDLTETVRLAERIHRLAPVATSEFVTLGRSPTMLSAYFEAQAKLFRNLKTWTLPLSLKNAGKVTQSNLLARLERVIAAFTTGTGGDKSQIVVIDAVSKGRAFVRLDRLLAQSGRKVIFIGFSDDVESATANLKNAHMVNPYHILPVSHEYMLRLSAHKAAAQFPSYSIESDEDPTATLSRPPVANPLFRNLRLQIEKELGL